MISVSESQKSELITLLYSPLTFYELMDGLQIIYVVIFLQAVRAAQDEQIRLKDVEINELKSLRMDLDRELRDTRTVSERVS